ncbi:translation initiation factor IF-2-like [Equus quagga]|uniref:translation initiation factor IF-2-like n=1 Tax=Equus quagga TaxID=89248 RepID=UPI001EE22432|nr:translation initiation factor IF-2-like [Equus quagga]
MANRWSAGLAPGAEACAGGRQLPTSCSATSSGCKAEEDSQRVYAWLQQHLTRCNGPAPRSHHMKTGAARGRRTGARATQRNHGETFSARADGGAQGQRLAALRPSAAQQPRGGERPPRVRSPLWCCGGSHFREFPRSVRSSASCIPFGASSPPPLLRRPRRAPAARPAGRSAAFVWLRRAGLRRVEWSPRRRRLARSGRPDSRPLLRDRSHDTGKLPQDGSRYPAAAAAARAPPPRPAPPAAPPAASAAGRASLRKSRCPEAAEARGRRRGRPGTVARPRRALCSFSPTTCLSGGPEGARRQGRPRRGSASASGGRSRREGEGPSPSPPSPLSSFVASTLGLRAALAVPPPPWECAGWTHSEHRELAPGDPGPRRARSPPPRAPRGPGGRAPRSPRFGLRGTAAPPGRAAGT